MNTRLAAKLFTAVALTALPAFASGLALSPDALPPATARALRDQIGAAHLRDPAAFRSVWQLRQDANRFDAAKRGPIAPMARALKPLGSQGVLPLIELLAFDSLSGPELTPGATLSLQIGALEALGEQRDPRAAPVLLALVKSPTLPVALARSAAEAYGFLQTDEAAAELVAAAGDGSEKGRALRAGLGSCRRVAVARFLAAQLAQERDEVEAVALIRALADLGNAWSWKTPGAVTKAEEAPIRELAAQALLSAFVQRTGHARQAANNALMVVDAPVTPRLIARARGEASAETVAALDALTARFQNNPTR